MKQGQLFLRLSGRILWLVVKKYSGWDNLEDILEAVSCELSEQHKDYKQNQRFEQLEQAASIKPATAREIAESILAEKQQNGEMLTPEQTEMVRELLGVMPAMIRERTQSTLQQARYHGTELAQALPLSTAFYRSLLPNRRPRFQVGDDIPHMSPRWVLQELLGIGNFGEVWRAQHHDLDDEAAIKFCLDDNSANMLKSEKDILKKIRQQLKQHPNIVHLQDYQVEQAPYWIKFDYIKGGTLESLMRARTFNEAESTAFMLPLIQAMATVHQLGIVHRDLKPNNILITEDKTLKIADFGIGKVLSEQERSYANRNTAFTVRGYGTMGYMPPEQEKGDPAHTTDDVYALGVIWWQLLLHTLEPPRFFRDSLEQANLSADCVELLSACIEKPRATRIQDASVLLQRFETITAAKTKPKTSRNRSTPAKQPTQTRSRSYLPKIAGMVVLTLGIIGLASQYSARSPKMTDDTHTSVVEPKMVNIPAGTFTMGCVATRDNVEGGCWDSEKPPHQVSIKAFKMSQYEVTFAEWDACTQAGKCIEADDKGWGRDQRPVINVSWDDAQQYIAWLNEETGKSYRLPSEAEWEYAARAGSTTAYPWGNKASHDYANYGKDDCCGGLKQGRDQWDETAPVGEFPANEWGLHDMHGNVWEWVADDWHGSYNGAPNDGSVWQSNNANRVLRGGSWLSPPRNLRSSSRGNGGADNRHFYLGLRLAL